MKNCDLTYLKSIAPGNTAFIKGVLQLFISDTPGTMDKARSSMREKNWAEFYKHIHKIKPSLELIGLNKPAIEAMLKLNDYSKAETNTEAIPELFDFLAENLKGAYVIIEDELKITA